MGVAVAAALVALAKVIGPSIASSLMAKALEKTAGRLWGLKKKDLEKKIEKASEDAFMDFIKAFPKGKAINDGKILERFFDSLTVKEELERVILIDHQIPNLHTLYQAFLDAGYTEDMLPGFDFNDAMNAFMGKFREELDDVIQHRRNEEKGLLRLYLDQVAEHCGRLDFVGIPELRDKRGLRVDEIFVPLRARQEVPEADILPEEEMEEEDMPAVHLRRARGESRTREAAPVKLDDALKDNDKVVILGGPGAGKTTMLRYVALTLAQVGKENSEEKLGLSRDLVPIFLELGRFAGRDDQGQSLVEFMYDYMNTCLSVSLPQNFFEGFLDQDRCIVLLDSLDEVATLAQRVEVKKVVTLFANRYRGNKFVLTSRSAGYREAPLNGDFAHFTVCDFTEEDIKDFAGKWYKAREGDTEDVQSKADDLVKAIKDNRRVAALARNPLMLTIIALIHRIEAKLPNQRIKLYDKCTESLLYTWEAVKRRGEEFASEEEKRSRCEKIAYWMQDMPGAGERERTVRRGELQGKLARILKEEGIPNMREARAEAKHFLDQIRRRTGVLIERGRDLYSFAHLTFQEYFAACEVYNRFLDAPFTSGIDSFWDEEIKPRLHDPRWQEAIPLFMGKVSAGSSKGASDLVRRILEAESPYDDILHRDLLLAGRCLADDVAVDEKLRKRILDEVSEHLWHGKYDGLRSRTKDVLTAMRDSRYEYEVAERHIKALGDDNSGVRSNAASALGRLGTASGEVVTALIKALGDDDWRVRYSAAETLGELKTASEDVIKALINTLGDFSNDVRASAASVLSSLGQSSELVVNALIKALRNEDIAVRSSVASALASLGQSSELVVDALTKALDDKDIAVRSSASLALSSLGQSSKRVVDALMEAMEDEDIQAIAASALASLSQSNALMKALENEDWGIRSTAALGLGALGQSSDLVVNTLVKALEDGDEYSSVRSNAASALGRLGQSSELVMNALMKALEDGHEDSNVRSNAASALGRLGQSSELVMNALMKALEGEDIVVRSSVVSALASLGQSSELMVDALMKALGDEYWRVRYSAAEALVSLGQSSELAMDALMKALEDGKGHVQPIAASALVSLGQSSDLVVNTLIKGLKDFSSDIRSNSASALGRLGQSSELVVNALTEALGDKGSRVRSSAASALGSLGTASGEVVAALINALGDDDRNVRYSAASALGKLAGGSGEAMNALLERLEVEKNSDAANGIFEAVYSLAQQTQDARLKTQDLGHET